MRIDTTAISMDTPATYIPPREPCRMPCNRICAEPVLDRINPVELSLRRRWPRFGVLPNLPISVLRGTTGCSRPAVLAWKSLRSARCPACYKATGVPIHLAIKRPNNSATYPAFAVIAFPGLSNTCQSDDEDLSVRQRPVKGRAGTCGVMQV